MDQKKTGYFLKQLRNEKKLTQEQLGENVSKKSGMRTKKYPSSKERRWKKRR